MATTHENWLSRRKGKQSDLYKLDTKNKTPEENIKEIIQGLYLKKPFHNDTSPTSKNNPMEFKSGLRGMQKSGSDSRRLSYLNALVTLLCKEDRNNLGFTPDELMTCIRVSLVDDAMAIRASALRVLRYLIKTETDVATFNNLKLPFLVIRSMDLMLRNEEERAQALRVVRRVVAVVGATGGVRRQRGAFVEHGLLRCLAAVARAASAGDGTGDRLSRPAIATLAEICVLNPDMFISCGGVNAVTRQLAECATPRMAEALCGVLLHALNDPTSRRAARIDLMCLSSPYCDFHFRPAGTETSRDEREMRFTCSRLALLCVLRSWPGLLHFCHPCSTGGLRALVAALYLPRLEVRKAILDLLYELVGLPQPEWTDEISVALDAVDPSDFQDSWRLNEGFVAAEGTAILPHLGATGPDIIEIHLALLLQCFLEAGLLDGLAEVIVTSDTFISVRATVLLGQLLHLIHLYLPPQICSITPALPTLMSQASAGKPQALAAVAALRRLHSMLEARPASSSLFLDHIIQYCSGAFREKVEDNTKSRKEKDNASMVKPKHDVSLHKENSIEFLNDSDNENEPKQRHSVGSRADVPNRNVSALVKSKSVSSRTSAAVSRVTKTAKFFNLFERDSDSLIRCTLVMQNKDGNTWNWDIIRTILKENDTPLLNLNDGGHKAWVVRIINYLKPSSNKYSHTDLSSTCHGHSATRAGCQLIRHLLRHNDLECQRLLEDLFLDVSRQIEAIETGLKAHECLFSPQHMCNTMCQMYFLFIGQLCHSQNGLRLFKQTGLYENLLELSTRTHHSCYVKLVISSLDYTMDSFPRDILAKTLTCSIQASRLYATQFLNVLLRASRKSRELVRRKAKLKKNAVNDHLKANQRDNIEPNSGVDMDTWILQMLVGQIKDESKVVVKTALTILEEAYHVPSYVEKLITMKETLCQNCHLDKTTEPSALDFAAISDRGYLLWLSLEVAVAVQSVDAKSIAFLKKHLDFWTKSYNYRYVRLVEAGVHEALAVSEAGGLRGAPRARRAARPPPHLHAALAPRSRTAHPAHPTRSARALLQAVLPDHYKVSGHIYVRLVEAGVHEALAVSEAGGLRGAPRARRAARPPPHLHAALAPRSRTAHPAHPTRSARALLQAVLPDHYKVSGHIYVRLVEAGVHEALAVSEAGGLRGAPRARRAARPPPHLHAALAPRSRTAHPAHPTRSARALLQAVLPDHYKVSGHRYVRLVEAGVHEALAVSEAGGLRGAPRARRAARPPPHLHAALAPRSRTAHPAHPTRSARALLQAVLPDHYKVSGHIYVRLVEAGVHEALAVSEAGGLRGAPRARRAARPPPHLHAALAPRSRTAHPAHPTRSARALLQAVLPDHYKVSGHRYVRLVEAGVHEALAVSEAGGLRGAPRARRAARPPPHLHAALAPRSRTAHPAHPTRSARALLQAVLPDHYKVSGHRYVRLVEAGVHEALAVSEAGGLRGAPRARRAARPPPHLHAALAPRSRTAHPAHPTRSARALLQAVLPDHYKILQRKKCANEQEIADIKASLWAVGNTAVTSQGLQQLMSLSNGYLEDSVLVHIVRLAKYNPVYSVRATAFYVLGLIGSTYDGANLLSDLGWLCVRHTRHDQFPVIPDEAYATFEQGTNVHYYVTSPECRYNTYDTEMSEHSDHTDQSVAESLHSDTTKLFGKAGSISADNSEIKDQDVTDHKSYTDGRPDKRKSHTLPSQSCSSSHDRPTLSESRTVDILRDCSSYERPGPHRGPMPENRLLIGRMNSLEHHEGRVRNTSESSTSGVSSCDSFLGKYAIPDRVLTLSPIPSSSSLYGMKSSNSTHRSKISELQRRTSTSSFSGNEVASSPPSQMDMTGYATLKSLNRRPYLSESAAGSSEMDDLSWLLSDTNRRSKPFSSLRDRAKSTKERMAKMSLLEYDWKPLPLGDNARASPPSAVGVGGASGMGGALQTRRSTCPSAPPPVRLTHGHSPAYIGICLPRDLMELFPRDEDMNDEDTDKSDHTKRDRIPSFLVDTSSASTENKSRATPDSQKLASHKASSTTIAVQIHKLNSEKADTNASNADNSIASVETSDNPRTTKEKTKRMVTAVDESVTPSKVKDEGKTANNEIKDDNAAVIATEIESQVANQVTQEVGLRSITDGGDNNVQSVGAVVTEAVNASSSSSSKKWRHITADCLACVRTRPPSSHELREAFFAGMDGSGTSAIEPRSPTTDKPTTTDKSGPQAELLHQVHFMSNPIHLRQARSVLLSMKQRHPEVFRSPCVYSDVSALLARDTYMLCARRFVQELFLDTCFDCFATEPGAVLSRHGVASPSASVVPLVRE